MRRKLIPPTKSEEAAINTGIVADPDTYELSDADFRRLKPVRDRRRRQTTAEAMLRDWLKTHRTR